MSIFWNSTYTINCVHFKYGLFCEMMSDREKKNQHNEDSSKRDNYNLH
jgi:hypothetical protein